MAKKTLTPALLALDTGMDIDDVLLLLWDAGVEYPVSPQSVIRQDDAARARSACGVVPVKERLLVRYWESYLGLDRSAFRDWAASQGVSIGPQARRLPKGALARFTTATAATHRPAKLQTAETPILKHISLRDVGHRRDSIRHLSATEIEAIHFQIAGDFANTPDPIAPAGVRSEHLLESAAGRSSTGMWGELKYPTVEMAAAALMHSIVQNHPFYNGNKRTALVSLLSFLDENGLVLSCSQAEIFRWTIRVAAHKLGAAQYAGDANDIEVHLMAEWLNERCRNVEAGERVVTFSELRRRLESFDCTVQLTGKSGGKAVVSRLVKVEHPSFFGAMERTENRRYFMPYGGDGRQVSRSRIKQMRNELHLSEAHGFDSANFYGSVKQPVDEFIAQYRKTLRRLAKV